MKTSWIYVLPFLANSAIAGDNGFSGNDWLKMCENKSSQALCYSYTLGLVEGLHAWKALRPDNAPICFPENVYTRQLVELGMKFVRENPETRHRYAWYNLTMAYRQTFPCEEQTQ